MTKCKSNFLHEFFNSEESVFDDELVKEFLEIHITLSAFYFFCKLRNPSLTVEDFTKKIFGY